MKGTLLRILLLPLLVGALAAAALHWGGLERLELLTIDFRYRLLPPQKPAPVVMVAIDQESIKEVGVWPWPRSVYARAIETFSREGALRILLDLDLSSRGTDPGEDAALVKAAARSKNSFIAMFMHERVTEEGFVVANYSLPFPELSQAAAGVGSILFDLDGDEKVRRIPSPVSFADEVFLPLGVLGARAVDAEAASAVPAGALINLSPADPGAVPTLSFMRVLAGEYPEGFFRDRVVLVGATSPDLRDFWASPIGVIPGPYLHASVMNTLLNRSYLSRPDRWMGLLLTLLCSLLLGLGMGRTGWKGGALVLAVYLGAVAVAAGLALNSHLLLEVVPLLLAGMVQYPVQVAFHARRTEAVLEMERRRTDAILKMSELEDADKTGQEPYVVPLVLLRQVLGLSMVRLFLLEEERGDSFREEAVFGEGAGRRYRDPDLLAETVEKGELIWVKGEEGRGPQVYVPLRTVRKTMGVLLVGWPLSFVAGEKEMRLLLSYATQTAYFLESRQLARKMKEEETVRTNLSRYLSPQIVEQVIAEKVQVNLGGTRKAVTVLFSDIRNFTAITESMRADQLVAILNEYFTEMAGVIFQWHGSLDKYIGDAIVAVFGSLIELPNATRNAVDAAVAMQKLMPSLNRRWEERYGGFNMQMGIGVNSGEVFLGNIGSLERMEFTVIGDAVNVASRFSGLAKAGQILLTRAARDQVGPGIALNELGRSQVKGKTEMLEVFEVVYERPGNGVTGGRT